MLSPQDLKQLCDLFSQLHDAELASPDRERLQQRMLVEPEVRRLYLRYMRLNAGLAWDLRESLMTDIPASFPADAPQTAPSVATGAAKRSITSSLYAKPASPVLGFLGDALNTISRGYVSPQMLAIATAAALSAYFVGLLMMVAVQQSWVGRQQADQRLAENVERSGLKGHVSANANKIVLANLMEVSGCVWDVKCPRSTVEAGQSLELLEGVVEFRFGNGVNVAVVGPCSLRFESLGRLLLNRGKLIARVPPGAEGFTVASPSADVVDLGTEFGVEVAQSGETNIQVLKGKVDVKAPADSRLPTAGLRQGITLWAGQAARVSAERGFERVAPDKGRVTLLDSTRATHAHGPPRSRDILDLVDLIAGGDGTGHSQGVAVDHSSGNVGPLEPMEDLPGDGKYHSCRSHRTLDGCFVPNGPSSVDSLGHIFDFPETDGQSYAYILGRDGTPLPQTFSARVGEVDYTQPGHSLVFMHCNKGLTVDLSAVRSLKPDRDIKAFRAVVGHSWPHGEIKKRADVFIIVDGKSRFERRAFTNEDAPFKVEVPLDSADQFLTLASTDGGDSYRGDWVLFGDPQLDLHGREK